LRKAALQFWGNRRLTRWFVPGLGVKRWLVLMLIGLAMLGLGIGYIQVQVYRQADVPEIFYYLTLQFVPRLVRALLFGGLGVSAFLIGLIRFNATLLNVARGNDRQPIIDKLWQQRIGALGPRVVAIGGGHGLSALLRGLKAHTSNITAIVTVADDGGSSGRLRREYGVLPPGDFRMCIAALADDESLVTQLFQYRFGSGADAGASALTGHSFGNLFIAAMAELTGSFEKAVIESSRVVASQGRILPSTLEDVTLCAEFTGLEAAPAPENAARGESSIGKTGRAIERVWLEPNDPPAFPDAVRAILEAEIVVLGPGSLYTSVLPNALVRGIAGALGQTKAPVVYICNVATETGETDGYSLDQHVDALERHIGRGIIDIVLANDRVTPDAGPGIVRPSNALSRASARVITADVVDEAAPDRHDPRKLGSAIMGIIRGGKSAQTATTHVPGAG
jgi:uncharacterized cofD-like protein